MVAAGGAASRDAENRLSFERMEVVRWDERSAAMMEAANGHDACRKAGVLLL
jgi:hypothetical protein